MNLTQDRTQEIKRELAELSNAWKMTVQKAARIGQLLTEQKDFLGHGNFLPWLNNNFDMTDETARKYMKLFEYRDKTQLSWNLQAAYNQIETIEKQEKAAKARERMSQDERDRSMIVEFGKTGIKPIGWTARLDKRIKDSEEGYARQQERIEKLKQEQNQKSENEKKRREAFTDPLPDDEKAGHYYRLGKLTEEMLNNASTSRATHFNKRQEWKEKIRLSSGGKEDAFMDAIIEYLETLPDDNRRIEACNNIIKICRNISVELQRNKAA
jgi:hypothetical protein